MKLSAADIAQLGQYMSTLVNQQHVKSHSTVGMLLDRDSVRFAFSALCLPDHGKTPLSIVVVTPSLKWRTGTAVQRGVCIAMCLLQKLSMNRMVVDESL